MDPPADHKNFAYLGVVGSWIFTVLSAASGSARATLSVMLLGFLEVHLGSTCLV
jgi:hypothetical protein